MEVEVSPALSSLMPLPSWQSSLISWQEDSKGILVKDKMSPGVLGCLDTALTPTIANQSKTALHHLGNCSTLKV